MLEAFFFGLPPAINLLLIVIALYIVTRASHYLVDGAVHIAHEFKISPLVIGATVVAVGTSSAELAVNLVVVTSGADTSVVAGNILGSNLINLGIELGVSALIAGVIAVPREAFEKDIPLYFAATGLVTALIFDQQIGRVEAVLMLVLFIVALRLIMQYARAKRERSILIVEISEIETISHPDALHLSVPQALLALFGGLAVLVLASRLLVLNTSALGVMLGIPDFIIGLVIIGPGTSLPEIASSIQAARRGHADLVLGTAFGSNKFNLLFGLGLPALIRPLAIGDAAVLSFIFLNVLNVGLLALVLLDAPWLGKVRSVTRVIGAFLVSTYLGFISYQTVIAANGTFVTWLVGYGIGVLIVGAGFGGWRAAQRLRMRKGWGRQPAEKRACILCATRGGETSQPMHQFAIQLAKERDADLLFLYVFDRQVLQSIATPIVVNVESQIQHMLAYLQSTAQTQARQAGVSADVIIRTGDLLTQIVDVARMKLTSLIILGSPSGKASRFKQKAWLEFIKDIEAATGSSVLIPD
jgi:cation:H+ antiporter